jgi:intracellular sulfur oxidation DsrE/DsrF family protein
MIRRWIAVLLLATVPVLAAVGTATAADTVKKVVLQISDAGEDKQTLVLNVANNLQTHYGIDNVKIEIVAFGPGLRLLFKDNVNANRIAALTQGGVRFSACENTVKGMAKQLGYEPRLNQNAVSVPAGIVRISELSEQGYLLVRP